MIDDDINSVLNSLAITEPDVVMFPLTNKLSVIPTAPSEAVSAFCKNDEVSA